MGSLHTFILWPVIHLSTIIYHLHPTDSIAYGIDRLFCEYCTFFSFFPAPFPFALLYRIPMVGIATTRGGVIALPTSTASLHGGDDGSIELKPLDTSQIEGCESSARMYAYDGAIVEVMRYQAAHASWMYITHTGTDTAVNIEPNGTLTMVTKIDPLFVALAFMACSVRQSGMFEPKENLLDTQDAVFRTADLALICDTKSAGDEVFYRFSREKALRWLDAKVFNIAKLYRELPEHEAAAVVAQYLPASWADQLTAKYAAPQQEEDKSRDIALENISDAQKMALEAMQSDAKKESDAVAAGEAAADSEPPKKKKKVSNKKPVTRSRNPITSFFKK